MYIFRILLLVLIASGVSSKTQHLDGNEDIFEDALLEHLRDVRDQEGSDPYYPGENDQEDQALSKDELLQVIDVIRKEAHKRHENLKKSIRKDDSEHHQDKKELSDETTTKKLETRQDDPTHTNLGRKREVDEHKNHKVDLINIDTGSQDENEKENNQVAAVEVDNSVEKEKELINKINLRDILKKDGNTVVTNAPPKSGPSHAHIKQEKVVSTKSNNKGLDRVSFIAVIAGCCVAAIAGIVLAAYCWYKLRVESKNDTENPKPVKKSSKKQKETKEEKPISRDDEMNVNAEYYNYQHAKSQIKQMSQSQNFSEKIAGDETSEDEEDEDTVYECPGLAAPGDMKVVNPMFSDGESRHSDKTSHDGSPTPPNERMDSVANGNNNLP